MKKILNFLKFAFINRNKWLVPFLIIFLVFVLVNYFLTGGGIEPFGYKIF